MDPPNTKVYSSVILAAFVKCMNQIANQYLFLGHDDE